MSNPGVRPFILTITWSDPKDVKLHGLTPRDVI
jgi:hypothetical protein